MYIWGVIPGFSSGLDEEGLAGRGPGPEPLQTGKSRGINAKTAPGPKPG
jgi:hypothetical protein